MTKLEQARLEIDRIDREMAGLFEKRMKAVEDVVAYKKANGLPVLDASREKEVLARCSSYLSDQHLCAYYEKVLEKEMEVSRAYQRKILGRDRVGYQGTEGAFGHIAAHHLFPSDTLEKYASFSDVVQAVEDGSIYRGVIPFENSYTGEVGEVLDLLYTHSVYIEQIYDQPVCQNLLGVSGSSLGQITAVYSHPQALQQASRYLDLTVPNAQRIPYANTAVAAKFVAEQQNPAFAAIASELTAELYGLSILAREINTSAENTTRFIVLSKDLPKEGNRFNLLFTVDHEAGQLAKIMALIGDKGFNLESIKSRSVRGEPWKYYFYAEVVGSLADPRAKELIELLEQRCSSVRILGHYRKEMQK